MSDTPAVEVRVRPELSLATDVLTGTDRPIVKITVAGSVGSAKTAILSLIQEMLQAKGIKVALENDYTLAEMRIEQGTDHDKTLQMYSPAVVLEEVLVPRNSI
jgi:pantothenate kinase-related protein Tda10